MDNTTRFIKSLIRSNELLILCIMYSIYTVLLMNTEKFSFYFDNTLLLITVISMWILYATVEKNEKLAIKVFYILRITIVIEFIIKVIVLLAQALGSVLIIVLPDFIKKVVAFVFENTEYVTNTDTSSFLTRQILNIGDRFVVAVGIILSIVTIVYALFILIYYFSLIRFVNRAVKTYKNNDPDLRVPGFIVVAQIILAVYNALIFTVSLVQMNFTNMIRYACLTGVYILSSLLIYKYRQGMIQLVNERPYIIKNEENGVEV